MSITLPTFDGLDEPTQAALILAAPQGALLGRFTKVGGSRMDRQDARLGVYEALELAETADKATDKATADAYRTVAQVIRGPHSEALLTRDGLPARTSKLCDCRRPLAGTVEFQRWMPQGLVDSGHVHTDRACRGRVLPGEPVL